MKIGIDIRSACGDKAGKGWYTYHLVRNLIQLDQNNEYVLYGDCADEELKSFIEKTPEQNRSRHNIVTFHGSKILWHWRVLYHCKKNGIDLFFAPTSFIVPAFLPPKIKSVITVHDLVSFLFPKIHQTKAQIIEKLFLKRALSKATRVVCISENTKRDLIKLFHVPDEKVAVVYPAASIEVSTNALKTPTSRAPAKFILAVGTLEPRKNFKTLIEAFALFHKKYPDVSLRIAGGAGWKEKFKIHENLPIQFLGYTPAEKLAELYATAHVLVFPSLYEGFGMPPLEAMSFGCPVICSNTGSLPEVVGDAALLLDPKNAREIAGALEKLFTDDGFRKKLIAKGRERARQFSWEKSAKMLIGLFQEIQH